MKQYNVTGMSCAACSAHVEKAVSAVPGVTSCTVSLLTNSMTVEGSASPADVIAAVEAAGYGAAEKGARREAAPAADELKDTETPRMVHRLIASIIFWLPLMYIMGWMLWRWPLPPFFENNHLALMMFEMLDTIVVMVINQKFFVSGFKGLVHRAPNMDTLVAHGCHGGLRLQHRHAVPHGGRRDAGGYGPGSWPVWTRCTLSRRPPS